MLNNKKLLFIAVISALSATIACGAAVTEMMSAS